MVSGSARAAPRLEPDDLPAPQPEIVQHAAKVELPAVPSFELPPAEPGFHRPRELRVRGTAVLGLEIKVRGYVTWIYDCAAALAAANPRASRAELIQSIDRDPRACDRPRFQLGDLKGSSHASIWVVDVPRRPAKPEREALSNAELAVWPKVPTLAVGDHVVVTGTWATESPHGERNTDGLLVYKALAHAPPAAGPGATVATPATTTREPEIAVVTEPPLRKLVDNPTFNASVDHGNACSKAVRAGRYDAALPECEAATKIWSGNHLAWYAAASAHIAKTEWPEAVAAVRHAVTLRPDQAMYQLYYGMSLYEVSRRQPRPDRAQREHEPSDGDLPDASGSDLQEARDALLRATRLAPALWRAHYYLGRIDLDLDATGRAAEQFSRTIATHPGYRPGYIALIELYRRWDYLDQAIAVALLGTANVAAGEAGELWYEAGLAYGAKRADDQALGAFSNALAADPGSTRAKFARGQMYARKGELARAKRDLEEVTRATDPQLATARAIAAQLIAQLTRKQHGRGPPTCSRQDKDLCIPDLTDVEAVGGVGGVGYGKD